MATSKLKMIQKYCTTIDVEVSEMTDEQREQVISDMHSAGFRFNRSEARYESCLMYVFDVI